jgi:hypothetical protein
MHGQQNIKFHENPSSRNLVVPCGRTDRHYEANTHFSQFRKRAEQYYQTSAFRSTIRTCQHQKHSFKPYKPNTVSNANNVTCGEPREPRLLSSFIWSGQSGIRVLAWAKDFAFLQNRPDRIWSTRNLLYNAFQVSFLGVKGPGCEVDHLHPIGAEVNNKRR